MPRSRLFPILLTLACTPQLPSADSSTTTTTHDASSSSTTLADTDSSTAEASMSGTSTSDTSTSDTSTSSSTTGPAPFCGDGNVDPGEDCDDMNDNPNDGCKLCARDRHVFVSSLVWQGFKLDGLFGADQRCSRLLPILSSAPPPFSSNATPHEADSPPPRPLHT